MYDIDNKKQKGNNNMDKLFYHSDLKVSDFRSKFFDLKVNGSSAKEYLPLAWCKAVSYKARRLFGENVSIDKLKLVISSSEEPNAYEATMQYSKAIGIMFDYYANGRMDKETKYIGYMYLWQDMDCVINMLGWERSKQVFKLDDDFLKALLETENVMIPKDVFDHLPYNHFYVDLSECKEICEEIDGEGFFVYITLNKNVNEKIRKNPEALAMYGDSVYSDEPYDMWQISLCKVSRERYQTDTIFLKNEETFLNTCRLEEKMVLVNSNEVEGKDNQYRKLAIQVLLYLASVEPDIEDSEMTKETYRAPNPNFRPKNKFSEIKAWDVGIKYGTAFRNWKEQPKEVNTSAVSTGTGNRKRPHCRRAHYHYFWYGKKDGKSERVKRQKWVSEMFINAKKDTAMPIVIHKVKE